MVFRNVCNDTVSSIRRIIYIPTHMQDKNVLLSSDGVTSSCCAISYSVYCTHLYNIKLRVFFHPPCDQRAPRFVDYTRRDWKRSVRKPFDRAIRFNFVALLHDVLCYILKSQPRLCSCSTSQKRRHTFSTCICYAYPLFCFKLFVCDNINVLLIFLHF